MLLGGLWHGASWNFVIWGALHGVFLVAERGLTVRFGGAWTKSAPARAVLGTLTFALVCVAWVFFRAPDLGRAMMHVAAMMGAIPIEPILKTTTIVKVLVTMTLLVGWQIATRDKRTEETIGRMPVPLVTGLWAIMLGLIVLTQGGGDAFIYFQF
jgi:alginate O-acetyltransferase complex protein AlgI